MNTTPQAIYIYKDDKNYIGNNIIPHLYCGVYIYIYKQRSHQHYIYPHYENNILVLTVVGFLWLTVSRVVHIQEKKKKNIYENEVSLFLGASQLVEYFSRTHCVINFLIVLYYSLINVNSYI